MKKKGPPGFKPGTYQFAIDCSATKLWTLLNKGSLTPPTFVTSYGTVLGGPGKL